MSSTRIALFLVLLAAASSQPTFAQSHPRVDVFGGYSILPADSGDFPRQTSHGLQVSLGGHFNSWFGVFGDIGAHFNTARNLGPGFAGRVATSSVREYFVGPRFTARSAWVNAFGHGLLGWAAGDAGPGFSGFSDSALAFGGGAGVDVRVSHHVAVRVQYDLLASFADIVEDNSRFAIGVAIGIADAAP
jgi:opacity protein-like surface antigen